MNTKLRILKIVLILAGLSAGIYIIYLGGSDENIIFTEKEIVTAEKINTEINEQPIAIEDNSDSVEEQVLIIEEEAEKNDDAALTEPVIEPVKITDNKFVIEPRLTPAAQSAAFRQNERPVFENNVDTSNMILINAGQFPFGDDDSKKNIFVDAFYIDKFEVSNEEYKSVFPNYRFRPGDEKKPVTGISYSEALEFAKIRKKDLPTVFEWEKAAGWDFIAKRKLKFSWGNDYFDNYTNSGENFNFAFEPVNSQKYKDISPSGIFFMSGNASEWTKTTLDELVKIIPAAKIDNADLFKLEKNDKYKFAVITKGGSIFDNRGKLTTSYNYAADGLGQTGIGFRCVYRPAMTRPQ